MPGFFSQSFHWPSRVALALAWVATLAPATGECIGTDPQKALRAAAVVFAGRINRVESLTRFEPIDKATGKVALESGSSGDPFVASFSVQRVWKGNARKEIQVFGVGSAMGPRLRPTYGKTYFVYAFDDLEQDRPDMSEFSKRSRVYNFGFPCLLRVATDARSEAKALGRGDGRPPRDR